MINETSFQQELSKSDQISPSLLLFEISMLKTKQMAISQPYCIILKKSKHHFIPRVIPNVMMDRLSSELNMAVKFKNNGGGIATRRKQMLSYFVVSEFFIID